MHDGKTECGDKNQSDFDVEKTLSPHAAEFFIFEWWQLNFQR